MSAGGRAALASLAAAAVAVGAYHVLVRAPGNAPSGEPRAPSAIGDVRAEFEAWKRDASARRLRDAGIADAEARIDALEKRLAELERTAGRPKPPARPPSDPPRLPLPASTADVPTEAQLTDLERMLHAVSEREALDRESTGMWGLVRNAGADLLPAQESAAVTRLLGFRVRVRSLYAEIPDQSKMTPADIKAFQGKIKDLRAALEDDLSRIVGAVPAARIAASAPPASQSTQPESTPPGK